MKFNIGKSEWNITDEMLKMVQADIAALKNRMPMKNYIGSTILVLNKANDVTDELATHYKDTREKPVKAVLCVFHQQPQDDTQHVTPKGYYDVIIFPMSEYKAVKEITFDTTSVPGRMHMTTTEAVTQEAIDGAATAPVHPLFAEGTFQHPIGTSILVDQLPAALMYEIALDFVHGIDKLPHKRVVGKETAGENK